MNDIVADIDTYLSLLLNAKVSPITVLSSFFLIFFRIIPSMVLAPFFGAKTVTGPIRIMFAISIVAIFLPGNVLGATQEIPFDLTFIFLCIKELLIGFTLGFLVTIPFYVAQGSGSLIDHIRGSSSLQVSDPTTQSQTGPVGLLYNYVLITIFFFIGGPFIYFDGIAKSFQLIPIEGIINPSFFSLNVPFWGTIIGLINQILALAIQLGAPSIIGILMAEMFLGIANRLAPQAQIVFLGISLKSWVGLGLLATAWYFILNQLGKETLNWLYFIEKTINHLAP